MTATNTVPVDRKVNIRPGVNILSVLQHLNYRPWFALAEFVDNAVQSYLAHKDQLHAIDGSNYQLRVTIEPDFRSIPRIVIRDNAAGIFSHEYARAFRPAELPPNRSGLSEFGMGMKSAACWFAPRWSVRTTAIGESVERTISFNLAKIVQDKIEELEIVERPASPTDHYTEVVLEELHHPPQTKTVTKIKRHLASIYRMFTRDHTLELVYDRELLTYEEPNILQARYFKDPEGDVILWKKDIDLDFGLGWRATGFAALRETGSTSEAGFALFRRKRLIQGSADEAYRPEYIFGKSNSYTYQRLFGELTLDGFEVSHTKDGFHWDDHEEIFLEELKRELDKDPVPLLRQAEGYRSRPRREDVQKNAETATSNTVGVIQREGRPVLDKQLHDHPDPSPPAPSFLPTTSPDHSLSKRQFEIRFDNSTWKVAIELANDPSVGDWLSIYDVQDSHIDDFRSLGIRLNLSHPFSERFSGNDPNQLEAQLRIAVSIALAEVTARDSGVRFAGEIRRRINQLLRDVLSKPA